MKNKKLIFFILLMTASPLATYAEDQPEIGSPGQSREYNAKHYIEKHQQEKLERVRQAIIIRKGHPQYRMIDESEMLPVDKFRKKIDLEGRLGGDYGLKADAYEGYWLEYVGSLDSGRAPDDAVVRMIDQKNNPSELSFSKRYGPALITIGGPEGEALVRKNYGSEIPESEIKKSIWESRDCKSGLEEGKVKNCFAGLDPELTRVFPETSARQTYLRSLSNLSSIVDGEFRHKCAISVYKKNVWVTAMHCIKPGYKVLVGNLSIPLGGANAKIIGCGEGCDVAFIEMETPEKAEEPDLEGDVTSLAWSTDLFIPSIPEDTSLVSILDSLSEYEAQEPSVVKEKYNKKVIWSPYGEGFCKVIKKYSNGCIAHACNTVGGFSGAPIYSYDKKTNKITLLGVHSGSDAGRNKCEPKQEGPKLNYARLVTRNGVKK